MDPDNIILSDDSLSLPPWMTKPAKNVSLKLKKFIQLRGITEQQAAEETGIEYKILKPVIDGRFIPPYEVCLRLCHWMFGKKTFRKNRMVSEYQKKDHRRWSKRSVNLRTATWQMIDKHKKIGGMTTSAFVDLCVTLVVNDNMILSSLQKAADRMEEARVAQIMSENPALMELLRGSLKKAKDDWESNTPTEEFTEPLPIQTVTTREDFDKEWSFG